MTLSPDNTDSVYFRRLIIIAGSIDNSFGCPEGAYTKTQAPGKRKLGSLHYETLPALLGSQYYLLSQGPMNIVQGYVGRFNTMIHSIP